MCDYHVCTCVVPGPCGSVNSLPLSAAQTFKAKLREENEDLAAQIARLRSQLDKQRSPVSSPSRRPPSNPPARREFAGVPRLPGAAAVAATEPASPAELVNLHDPGAASSGQSPAGWAGEVSFGEVDAKTRERKFEEFARRKDAEARRRREANAQKKRQSIDRSRRSSSVADRKTERRAQTSADPQEHGEWPSNAEPAHACSHNSASDAALHHQVSEGLRRAGRSTGSRWATQSISRRTARGTAHSRSGPRRPSSSAAGSVR